MKGKEKLKGVSDTSLALPFELLQENYTKRTHSATFDKIDFVVNFRAGKDGIGAVMKSFKSAIFRHDECVKLIEQKIDEIFLLKRELSKRSRLFRNLDSAWNAVQEENATAFQEYSQLVPKVRNAEERLKVLTDVKLKSKLQANYTRYLELHPKCANQLVILETYNVARASKDDMLKQYIAANKELSNLKAEEKLASSFISDDHILADSQKKTLMQLFPNVHVGNIITSLNGEDVRNVAFPDIIKKMRTAKPPHKAEFQRYDYRYNPFTNEWKSLQELREGGVCVEDPMVAVMDFIRHAAVGDIAAVKKILLMGDDPNCKDYTGASPLLMAAVNNHDKCMELLIRAGAEVNTRDKNMMTPLLFCVSRGNLAIVRQLINCGADKYAADKNDRNGVYYAVLSGNENMIQFFLRPNLKNKPDSLWGFTPLHLAVSQGNSAAVRSLLSYGCSIYSEDRKGKTPEDVAAELCFESIRQILHEDRASAPAQRMMFDKMKEVQIWIGDKSAMHAAWASELDFTHVIYFKPNHRDISNDLRWLRNDESVNFTTYVLPIDEDDDSSIASYSSAKQKRLALMRGGDDISMTSSTSSQQIVPAKEPLDPWETFSRPELMAAVVNQMLALIQAGNANILIVDDSGDSTPPCVYCIMALVRYQIRIEESLKHVEECRPSVNISLSFRRGLSTMQKRIDQKVMKRLNDRMRQSSMISLGF